MSEAKFKTMRHIETVRNYLNLIIKDFLERSIQHDQTKLELPEVEALEAFTPRLRKLTYGSEEYKKCLEEMAPFLRHHYSAYSHHPEHFANGLEGMNLLDLLEMICDWKAATLRHDNGDIYRSLKLNKERYEMSEQLYKILMNTVIFIESKSVYHKANES